MQTGDGRKGAGAPVVVLGMHRSGTSCLAGCLEAAGIHLGDVNRKAPANPRGNCENRAIMDLHDAVLADNGGSWDAPPGSAAWRKERVAERNAIVANYPTGQVWGFKDPRTLLVFDGWREALPGLRPVGTFRHPTVVGASLARRNGFSMARGYALWTAYNSHLLAYTRTLGFPLICFDYEPERYCRALGQLLSRLGLASGEAGAAFFEGALRNACAATDPALPDSARRLYEQLTGLSE